MNLIKVILIASAATALVVYLAYFRSAVLDRLIAMLLFAVAVLAIVFPDSTTGVANAMGVGRGTDLLLYLFLAMSVFYGILFYSRVAKLEETVTALVRHQAVTHAERAQRDAAAEPAGHDPHTGPGDA